MVLKQYYLGCLSHASYLIAEPASREAAVVDPQRDVDQYLEDARELDCVISHVFLTHFHADFLAGHLELRDRAGAEIHLGAAARADYEFTPMHDGAAVRLGAVELVVLETPGHSRESISILICDRDSDRSKPRAVLTGDTLFIGDVGRPDLRASLGWSAEELGGMLFDSLQEKILALPDETLVYPAHGAGSLCGKSLSTDTVSTIGRQRLENYALQPMSRERFVEIVTADQPDAPAYFTYDAILNTKERGTLEAALRHGLRPLALGDVLGLVADGAQLLDTRAPDRFERRHLRGSVNVALCGSYATWCGTVLEIGRPIVLVTERGAERESAMRLGRIGFDSVVGYLDGGADAFRERPDLIDEIKRVSASDLASKLASDSKPSVIDVRSESECSEGAIEGSLNIPLPTLGGRLERIADDRPTVVLCTSGYRSAIAASLMRRAGIRNVFDLAGGYLEWSTTAGAGMRLATPKLP